MFIVAKCPTADGGIHRLQVAKSSLGGQRVFSEDFSLCFFLIIDLL